MNSLPPPERFLEQLQRSRLSLTEIEAEIARRQAEIERKASIEADRESCKSLSQFIKRAWPVIEPGTPYVHNWHVDAIAEHLEAVNRSDIRRLMITVPPGSSKSTAVGVFFPMWCWGPARQPHMRFVGVAHEQTLGIRDNVKCRRLVSSEWFQERWPVIITSDQNEKLNFETQATGFRQVATTSNITGRRGDCVILDDILAVQAANSVVEREAVNLWMAEALPTRLNNPEKSAIVLVQQRLHSDDPVGMITAKGWGWEHLNIPMRYEPDRRCYTSLWPKDQPEIGIQPGISEPEPEEVAPGLRRDPRTKAGELFFPARFPEHVVAELERTLGPFATAAQLQQQPVPREGAMFKRAWFRPISAAPSGTRWVRYWDLAATTDQFGADPAWTVGLKLGRMPDGRYLIGDVARLRAEGTGVRRLIKDTARDDGPFVEIGLPIDPGQAGKVQSQDMIAMLAGYVVRAVAETGEKATRAEPIAAQAEAGNLCYLAGQEWEAEFFAEVTTFPGSKFKDQVDALSGAFSRLMRSNMFGVAEEQIAIEPIKLPRLFGRVAALDVNQSTVSMAWAAWNQTTDTTMIYEVYSAPRQSLTVHADVHRRIHPEAGPPGMWIPVLFDPEAHGRTHDEGMKIATSMARLGVPVLSAPLDIEAAVSDLAGRLTARRLRVFDTAPQWFAEYRRFTRDEKGEIPDGDTGIMHCTGLLALYGKDICVTENRADADARGYQPSQQSRAASSTGY